MFDAPQLNEYLNTAYTVRSKPVVLAEINLNAPDNIERIGVYKYRPTDIEAIYRTVPQSYDRTDQGDHYTDADLSYDEIDGGWEEGADGSRQVIFRQDHDKMRTLYSLEQCFGSHRPRSGINKMLYLGTKFIDGASKNPAMRPRYYPGNRYDYFKYWTSFKREGARERGVSYRVGTSNLIDDAVPFVVYRNPIPANRIVVKMQTHAASETIGSIYHNGQYIPDPFYGEANKRVPKTWHVELLRNGSWSRAYTFRDSTEIPVDGHVELGYGIEVPGDYQNIYTYKGELVSTAMLPGDADLGDMYLVSPNENDLGTFWIMAPSGETLSWHSFQPVYRWAPESKQLNGRSAVVHDIVDPQRFRRDNETLYREFQMIEGIRLVVQSMNTVDSTFDLIEMSPRLVMDWTGRTVSFSVEKSMADLASSAVPIGTLKASTGDIQVDNSDSAFNVNNVFDIQSGTGSIIADYQSIKTKISFYENILDADGLDYFVPIKTLYTETTPAINNDYESVNFSLRDLYYLFESVMAPSMLLTDVSLSRAVLTLMDYVGFTNFTFKRKPGQVDPIIPYFFVSPDKNVAEVLIQLAAATQSAMYFDEFNNLIIGLKEYILPEQGERKTDFVLRGNSSEDGLANFSAVSSADRQVFNAGEITFTKRYIQRSYGSINQAMYQPQDKTWIYQPSLIWEVSGTESVRPVNENAKDQSTYTLSAFPLARPLSAQVPEVQGGQLVYNTMDIGESANYVARYNGYVYANGEIIRYDAVQYAVTGTGVVWIKSPDEYQNHMLELPFGGRIYPTGLVRIYAEPYYQPTTDGNAILVSGPVERHGRGQFGTKVTSHDAGLAPYWSDNANVRGMHQAGDYLFSMKEVIDYPTGMIQNLVAGKTRNGVGAYDLARQSTRNGVMKNHLSQQFWSEDAVRRMTSAQAGTMQSSALIFAGPSFPSSILPRNHVSYIYKPLDNYYTNFGTRCRIIGKIETGQTKDQNPIGASSYFTIPTNKPDSTTTISGGSGGIGIHVNPETNNGYFFEIAALTSADPSSYRLEDMDIETNLGKVVSARVVDNVASVVIDKSVLTVVPDLQIYDMIGVSGVSGQSIPNINGVFRVEDITDAGATITYVVPIIAYTWLQVFGSVSKGGVDLGQILSASVDSNNIATVSFANPTGLNVGDKVSATNFVVSGSIPDINKTDMTVLTVSSDTRTITFQVPKANFDFPVETLTNSKIVKLTSQQTKLSNVWFYKTVADDLGGRITKVNRTDAYTEVTVDRHRLSTGDFVTISLPVGSPFNGDYQITNIVGNVITLNRGGSFQTVNYTPDIHNTIGLTTPVATPYRLWSGLTNVLVDTGQFWGQYRTMAESNTTVYDLGIEYVDSAYGRTFYLYINNKQVATVVDPNPLYKYNNMALFVRGQSKLMFENIYALGENIANGSVAKQVAPGAISEVFGIPDGINESESLRKYAVSGFVQSGYLAGISSKSSPQYNMYYDEFGTIMREAAYFNIKYDKAYPALYARIAPTINRIKGYTVSGFHAGAYGAEFMIFNCLDNVCSLDPSTGNYLRIHGVVFTQDTTKTLTVDDYLDAGTSISTSNFNDEKVLRDPTIFRKLYNDIKISRLRFGRNEFQIESEYIQSESAAEELMAWIISKVSRQRKNIGVDIFQIPTLQLGDIVQMDYRDENGDVVIGSDRQLVVYNITYSKSADGADMTLYLTEV